MASLRKTAAKGKPAAYESAEEWPKWTDFVEIDSTWELGPGPLPRVDAWPEYDSPEPPDGCTDLAGLLVAWSGWHKLAGDESDHAMHQLLSDELRSIASNVARGRHSTVAGYLACHHTCTTPDLGTLVVPAEGSRTSPLAALLDDEARGYLELHSEPARLCAWLCAGLADDCERWGSATVADYYDDLACWTEAGSAVAQEFAAEYAFAATIRF